MPLIFIKVKNGDKNKGLSKFIDIEDINYIEKKRQYENSFSK